MLLRSGLAHCMVAIISTDLMELAHLLWRQ